MNIRAALYAWRDSEARAKNIEGFRVFPNATLDAIVSALPHTKDELLSIKGIKEAKFNLYGKAVLKIISDAIAMPREREKDPEAFVSLSGVMNGTGELPARPAYTISQYLDILNRELYRITARVRGEVVSIQARGNAIYFTVKDTEAEGLLNVFMWSSDYKLTGIEIAPGLEIIIEGRAEIYKPTGKLSLRAQTLELVGEGALKKAYDALRKKLELEGLFAPERKRILPQFPMRIGVITSRQGAVIHDFLNNLGKFGFAVRFIDARVEGVLAVKEIYRAITDMRREDIDALVLVRGGGSLESLQAFNNEYVVRALAEFPKPVLCAIGHDKDVPLAQLVADYAPSTPTACTALLNESWISVTGELTLLQKTIVGAYEHSLQKKELDVLRAQRYFERTFSQIESSVTNAIDDVLRIVPQFAAALRRKEAEAVELGKRSERLLKQALLMVEDKLARYNALLTAHDPMRQLRLGYSILRNKGEVLRSVRELNEGATIDAVLADGTLSAKVIKVEQYDKKTTK